MTIRLSPERVDYLLGVLSGAHGGTGQSNYLAGDILYASASTTLSTLLGNTTTTRKFLRQTGTGTFSAAPVWDTLIAGDIPDVAGANGMIAQTSSAVYAARTITGTSNQVTVTNGDGVSGNPTLSLPQNIHSAATPQFAGLSLTVTNTSASGTQTLQNSTLTASPTTNSTASYRAMNAQLIVGLVDGSGVGITQSGSSIGTNLIAASSGTVLSGTASYSGTLQAFSSQVQHGSSAGTLANATTANISIAHLGGGAITNAIAMTSSPSYFSTGNTTTGRIFRAGSPTVRSGVASVAVGAGGSGYTAGATTAATSGGAGSGATFNVNVSGGAVTSIDVLHPGSGFTSTPSIVISGTGTSATATATIAKGTVTEQIAVEIQNQGNSAITSCAGLAIAAQSASANHAEFLVGTTTVPSGVVGSLFVSPTAAANCIVVQGLANRSGALIQLQSSAGASLGNVGGSIFDHFTDGASTHTNGTEDDLFTFTTVANTLGVNGDKIEIFYLINTVAHATATRRIQAYFAGTAIYDSTALATTAADAVTLTGYIIRESSTVVRCCVWMRDSNGVAFATAQYTRITGLTLSSTNIIKLTAIAAGAGAASGDVTAKLGRGLWHPAS